MNTINQYFEFLDLVKKQNRSQEENARLYTDYIPRFQSEGVTGKQEDVFHVLRETQKVKELKWKLFSLCMGEQEPGDAIYISARISGTDLLVKTILKNQEQLSLYTLGRLRNWTITLNPIDLTTLVFLLPTNATMTITGPHDAPEPVKFLSKEWEDEGGGYGGHYKPTPPTPPEDKPKPAPKSPPPAAPVTTGSLAQAIKEAEEEEKREEEAKKKRQAAAEEVARNSLEGYTLHPNFDPHAHEGDANLEDMSRLEYITHLSIQKDAGRIMPLIYPPVPITDVRGNGPTLDEWRGMLFDLRCLGTLLNPNTPQSLREHYEQQFKEAWNMYYQKHKEVVDPRKPKTAPAPTQVKTIPVNATQRKSRDEGNMGK